PLRNAHKVTPSIALPDSVRRASTPGAIFGLAKHGSLRKEMGVYDPDNLASAVTLNRVLEETLRLTPALYFFPRRATVDIWIETTDHRKMFIPKGTHLRLDVWHANRCEEFWGKAVTGYPAEAFAPDRWEVLAKKGITA